MKLTPRGIYLWGGEYELLSHLYAGVWELRLRTRDGSMYYVLAKNPVEIKALVDMGLVDFKN